jgi:hypothetical protein
MANSRGMGDRWNVDDSQNHFVASFWVGCESGWSRRGLNIGAIICDIWGGSQIQSPYQTVRTSSIQFSFPTHSIFVIRYSPCWAMRLITRTKKTCTWEHGYNHCFLHHLTDRSRDLTNDSDVDDLMDDVMVPGRRFAPRLRQKWFESSQLTTGQLTFVNARGSLTMTDFSRLQGGAMNNSNRMMTGYNSHAETIAIVREPGHLWFASMDPIGEQ